MNKMKSIKHEIGLTSHLLSEILRDAVWRQTNHSTWYPFWCVFIRDDLLGPLAGQFRDVWEWE